MLAISTFIEELMYYLAKKWKPFLNVFMSFSTYNKSLILNIKLFIYYKNSFSKTLLNKSLGFWRIEVWHSELSAS